MPIAARRAVSRAIEAGHVVGDLLKRGADGTYLVLTTAYVHSRPM